MQPDQKIIVDVINLFKAEAITQAMLASKLGVAPSQLAKAKKGTANPGATMYIRKGIEQLWKQYQVGENVRPTSNKLGELLWLSIHTLSTKVILRGALIALMLALPFAIPSFCGWTLQKATDVIGIKISEDPTRYLALNLLVSLLCLIANLSVPLVQSNLDQKVKSSSKDFSISWCLFWISWFFLYLTLCIAYFGFINLDAIGTGFSQSVSVTWAMADILNLLNTTILLHIFLNMYLKEYNHKIWTLILLLFIGVAWFAVLDRFVDFGALDGGGASLVSYISGIVVLLFIGRLNSLFIKVPFKLLFLAYFNFYALAQMKWGGDMSTEFLLIFLFAKMFLWAYVFEAFFRYNGKLEEYFIFVNREQGTNT